MSQTSVFRQDYDIEGKRSGSLPAPFMVDLGNGPEGFPLTLNTAQGSFVAVLSVLQRLENRDSDDVDGVVEDLRSLEMSCGYAGFRAMGVLDELAVVNHNAVIDALGVVANLLGKDVHQGAAQMMKRVHELRRGVEASGTDFLQGDVFRQGLSFLREHAEAEIRRLVVLDEIRDTFFGHVFELVHEEASAFGDPSSWASGRRPSWMERYGYPAAKFVFSRLAGLEYLIAEAKLAERKER